MDPNPYDDDEIYDTLAGADFFIRNPDETEYWEEDARGVVGNTIRLGGSDMDDSQPGPSGLRGLPQFDNIWSSQLPVTSGIRAEKAPINHRGHESGSKHTTPSSTSEPSKRKRSSGSSSREKDSAEPKRRHVSTREVPPPAPAPANEPVSEIANEMRIFSAVLYLVMNNRSAEVHPRFAAIIEEIKRVPADQWVGVAPTHAPPEADLQDVSIIHFAECVAALKKWAESNYKEIEPAWKNLQNWDIFRDEIKKMGVAFFTLKYQLRFPPTWRAVPTDITTTNIAKQVADALADLK